MSQKVNSETSKMVALIVTTLASFLPPVLIAAVNIALPTIGTEFGLDAITLSWITTSIMLSTAILLVPFGRLADIYGRKKMLILGMSISAISCLFSGFAPSAIILIIIRIIQGIGGAMMMGVSMAILTSVFPPQERGKVLGINVAAVYLGLSLGPFLGGILTHYLGWRSIFFVSFILSSIVVIIILWKLKGEWVEAKGEKFDLIGSIIYGLGLAALIYGFSLLPDLLGFILVATSIIVLAVFIIWELKNASPMLHINLFRNNLVFSMSNVAAFTNYMATAAVGLLMSLYLQYIKGFSPDIAGLIMIVQPAIMAIVSPFAGRLSDRFETRMVASTGMGLTTTGLIMLCFLHSDTDISLLFISQVVLGLGFGLFSAPNSSAVMGAVEKKYLGVASGTLGTMRALGQTMSMGITMLIFSLVIGRVQITPEYYPRFVSSMNIATLIFAVICVVGIVASLARGKTHS